MFTSIISGTLNKGAPESTGKITETAIQYQQFYFEKRDLKEEKTLNQRLKR